MPSQCQEYKNLTDSKRKYTYYKTDKYFCDKDSTYTGPRLKSTDWDYEGWYRVVGAAGTQLSEQNLTYKAGVCGTYNGGWMTGGHPSTLGKSVVRKIKFYNNKKYNIVVTNCDGYYVYNLKGFNQCYFRYCTQ